MTTVQVGTRVTCRALDISYEIESIDPDAFPSDSQVKLRVVEVGARHPLATFRDPPRTAETIENFSKQRPTVSIAWVEARL